MLSMTPLNDASRASRFPGHLFRDAKQMLISGTQWEASVTEKAVVESMGVMECVTEKVSWKPRGVRRHWMASWKALWLVWRH